MCPNELKKSFLNTVVYLRKVPQINLRVTDLKDIPRRVDPLKRYMV